MKIKATVSTNKPDLYGNVMTDEALNEIVSFVLKHSPVPLYEKSLGKLRGAIDSAAFYEGRVSVTGWIDNKAIESLIKKNVLSIVPVYEPIHQKDNDEYTWKLKHFSFTHLPIEHEIGSVAEIE